MTVLGVVAEINESDIVLHLPNGVKAHVNAANVSDVVTKQYRDALAKSTAKSIKKKQKQEDGGGGDDDDDDVDAMAADENSDDDNDDLLASDDDDEDTANIVRSFSFRVCSI